MGLWQAKSKDFEWWCTYVPYHKHKVPGIFQNCFPQHTQNETVLLQRPSLAPEKGGFEFCDLIIDLAKALVRRTFKVQEVPPRSKETGKLAFELLRSFSCNVLEKAAGSDV